MRYMVSVTNKWGVKRDRDFDAENDSVARAKGFEFARGISGYEDVFLYRYTGQHTFSPVY